MKRGEKLIPLTFRTFTAYAEGFKPSANDRLAELT
jgi:hypothetical protein